MSDTRVEKDFKKMTDEQFKEELSDLLKTRIPAENKFSDEEIVQELTNRAKEVLGSNSNITLSIATRRDGGFWRMGHAMVNNPNTGTLIKVAI